MKTKLLLILLFSTLVTLIRAGESPDQPNANPVNHQVNNSVNQEKPEIKKPENVKQLNKSETAVYSKAIEAFRQYMLKVKPAVRQEIREYKEAIKKLEKQKKGLYSKLTQEAQEYLAQEAKMKKTLPIKSEHTTPNKKATDDNKVVPNP